MNLLPAFTGAPEPDSIYNVDALTLLRAMTDNSVDAIVTDPPAGIAFMGKEWDKDKGGRQAWVAWMESIASEALRVLKPGGHALVWAIPRTSHWTGMAWEDAGFEPRDKVYHVFGSGFPKSHDISKAIDREAGAVRDRIGRKEDLGVIHGQGKYSKNEGWKRPWMDDPEADAHYVTAPATPEAQAWDGWGSALKPAVEEWWMFRKPLTGTLAQNTLAWGVGGLNIDACRVGTEQTVRPSKGGGFEGGWKALPLTGSTQGRWPANLVHDGSDEVTALFPVTGAGAFPKGKINRSASNIGFGSDSHNPARIEPDNGGSAARFFYCAKASSSERGDGNTHPTVKPIALMEWLIKLVTPAGALIVDPFMGSGTTLLAARNLNRRYIGCDITPEYVQIARERLSVPYTPDMFAWIDGEQSA